MTDDQTAAAFKAKFEDIYAARVFGWIDEVARLHACLLARAAADARATIDALEQEKAFLLNQLRNRPPSQFPLTGGCPDVPHGLQITLDPARGGTR